MNSIGQPRNSESEKASSRPTSEANAKLSYAKIKWAIDQARRELLDPSRRNRLLHAPLAGKRPWCMAIVDTNPDQVFDALYRREGFSGFGFKPSDSEDIHQEANSEHRQSPTSPLSSEPSLRSIASVRPKQKATVGSSRPRIQTKLSDEALEKRLTKIYREERTLEEEQGVSTLYLAVGFLKWFDSDTSDEPSFAPLVLVPVTMTRVRGPEGYILRGRDEEIIANVSLREKLRSDFGIGIPDFADNDDWTPSEYCTAVATEVARYKRWEVKRDYVGLGFFTFSKFMMWRDLDAGNWPQNALLGHPLLNVLIDEEFEFESDGPVISDDEPIDDHIDITKAVHVVPADSSQAVVVDEALHRRNLVVQGPPGTGKSQTITNIIAAAVHSGQSVLFVAEKTAALSVVHDRLSRAGLSPLCLEMHSRKANKRDVLKSLDEALRLSGTTTSGADVGPRLTSCRDKLNAWSKTIHRPIGQSGRTAFDIMGRQLQLRADGVRLPTERLDHITEWPAEKLNDVESAVDLGAAAVTKLGAAPCQHPFYGTTLQVQDPFEKERLIGSLDEAIQVVTALCARLDYLHSTFVGEGNACFADAFALVRSFRHLLTVPAESRVALADDMWIDELDKISNVIEHGQRSAALDAEINALFEPAAWTFDPAPLSTTFKLYGRTFFGRLGRRYKAARTALRRICRNRPPRAVADLIALVRKLENAQAARQSLASLLPSVSSALAPIFANSEPRWQTAYSLLAWTRAAHSEVGARQIITLAARAPDLAPYSNYAAELERSAQNAENVFKQICQTIGPDFDIVFGSNDLQRVAIVRLLEKLSSWRAHISAVNEWAAARGSLAKLRDLGFDVIAEGLNAGRLRPADARPVADLLIAEALWRRATRETPELMSIDGDERSDCVDEFRQLDERRIQVARQEVLESYLSRRPGGHHGDMGIIRAEIGKRRGHRAVRKLIDDAGTAVQRLKPIFLMSPLSVAQFIPPGRLTFDLLVIDEASQIAPEDALGVVARAKQIVVVGDHHQLPPTNFFKTVSAGGEQDDDGEETTTTTATRPGHYESILTLARSRGMSERMLAWHYRSRHPSLIALSNQECYSGRLLLPPSPYVQTTEFGLSLVPTPRGFYDRGGTSRDLVQAEEVAKAIAKQIRQFPNKSLGIACLSAQQRDAVDDMIDKMGLRAEVEAFSPRSERLFVKNLEAVQGDERDVIFISVGYGVAPGQSRPFLNFGPVSRDGGERRLNVLASRAREKCIVFSSITAADIPAEVPVRGTRMLRALLHFAETGKLGAGSVTGGDFESPFEEAVSRAIREAGYAVHAQVGVSSFRIDLGVINRARPGEYLLGVECDGATYHRARSARDRDRLRQEVLEGLGWRLFRIWSTDWFRNPAKETSRLLSAIRAVEAQSATPCGQEPEEEELPDTQAALAEVTNDSEISSEPPANGDQEGTEYQECALDVPVGRSLLDLTVAETGRLALAVVEAEGPIHLEEVARRIREAFGLQKTGNRILKHVRDALVKLSRSEMVIREDEFWSIPGREVQEIRTRQHVSLPLRRASMISPAEYQLAIISVIDESERISTEQLVIETARRFGFNRTGADLKQEINRQKAALMSAGKIKTEGSMLRASSTMH
jgi:very-short-patch-repair endonuclease